MQVVCQRLIFGCVTLPQCGNELPLAGHLETDSRRNPPCLLALEKLARQLHCTGQAKQMRMTMKLQPFIHHENALRLRAHRNEVLSSNIANADTPNYKARDVDFGEALKNARSSQLSLTKTSELHKNAWGTSRLDASVKYRIPMQPTLDGNTVETDVEQAAFAENAVQYRATLAFLDGQVRTLRYALKGGD